MSAGPLDQQRASVLDNILEHKRVEVAARKAQKPLSTLKRELIGLPPCRGFAAALRSRIDAQQPAVIAEIKRASPSKGVIRKKYEPRRHALSYEAAGAACLSVLTDERFFQGEDQDLRLARNAVALPVLRKDFIVDEYQIYEARRLGADCVLLIVAALNIMELTTFYQCARNLGLDVLIEVHDATELAAAHTLRPEMIGINNRNLKTFETRVDNTLTLAPKIAPTTMVISESGIHDSATVALLRRNGVQCFLVGEAFMREPDPGEALRTLFG